MSLNRRSFVGRLVIALGAIAKGKFANAAAILATSSGAGGMPVQAEPAAKGRIPGCAGGYIRPGTIETVHKRFELVVVGGGISGTCAAISAARNGAQVALVHERSTLGAIHPAKFAYTRKIPVRSIPGAANQASSTRFIRKNAPATWSLMSKGG